MSQSESQQLRTDTAYLRDDQWNWANSTGNRSEAIRKAIDFYRENAEEAEA